MTKAGFGDHLKREREMRGVSLDEICAATRISTRFLEALENEEWERLPGGVFNRGFVRAVARFLGLDEEGFVAEYALAVSERSATPNYASQTVRTQDNLRWLPLAVIVAVVLMLAGAGWFGWRWEARRRAQRRAAQSAAESVSTPPVAPAPALAPAAPTATDSSSADPAATGSASSSAVPAAASAAPPTPPPAVHEDLQLKIEAGKSTTINVSADGKTVFDGRIIAGQNRTFTAQTSFDVKAKDAGALLLELNGRTLAPIGPPGRPGKVKLTRHDAPAAAGG